MAQKQEDKRILGGFEFYASLSAASIADETQPYRIKGVASSSVLDSTDHVITETAIARLNMTTRIPLTVGAEHFNTLTDVLSIIGWGTPTVAEGQDQFTIVGYLKPEHPYTPSLYEDIKAYPEEYKLSIGGFVPSDGAVEEYDPQSSMWITYINEFVLDHILVCRANAAKNQSTWIEVADEEPMMYVEHAGVDKHDWGKMLFCAGSEVAKVETTKEKSVDMEGHDEQKLGFLAGLGQMLVSFAKGEDSGTEPAQAATAQEGAQEGTEAPTTQADKAPTKEAGKVEQDAKPAAEPAKEPADDAMAEQILSGVTSVVSKLEKTLSESVEGINTRVAAMEAVMNATDKPEDVKDDKPADASTESKDDKPVDDKPDAKAEDTPAADPDIAKIVEDAVAAKYEGLETAIDEHLGVIYGQIKEILGKLEVTMKARGRSSQVPIAGEPASLQDTDTTKTNSVATIISDGLASDNKV